LQRDTRHHHPVRVERLKNIQWGVFHQVDPVGL
jgi:hypothetical protein